MTGTRHVRVQADIGSGALATDQERYGMCTLRTQLVEELLEHNQIIMNLLVGLPKMSRVRSAAPGACNQ